MCTFANLHPVAAAGYFLSVLAVTMFSSNPMLSLAALLGGVLFYIKLQSKSLSIKSLLMNIVLFVLVALTNPLFSHKGATVLFFLNGSPVTLEAVLYGINIAVILLAVVYWFRCFNVIMTSDKLLFLFGKMSPKIALMISSALRFIPLFKEQAAKIKQSQRAMGIYASDSWIDRLKGVLRVYSALITWALENAVDTGSSMKASGYGLKGRTYYSLYRFGLTDAAFIGVTAVTDVFMIISSVTGNMRFSFYPLLSTGNYNVFGISAIAVFSVLSLLPCLAEVGGDILWKYCKSKI